QRGGKVARGQLLQLPCGRLSLDVQADDTGDRTKRKTEVAHRELPPPLADFLLGRHALLELLPGVPGPLAGSLAGLGVRATDQSYSDMVGRADGKDRPAERLPVVKGPVQAGSAVSKPVLLIDCCGILRRPAIVAPSVNFRYHGACFEFDARATGLGEPSPAWFLPPCRATKEQGPARGGPSGSLLFSSTEPATPQPVE